jgi:23S rRNA (uracil1939-C5)-methyltransferase
VICRHAEECGGCGLQQLAYPQQLLQKQKRVAELLRASLGPRAPEVAPPIGMAAGEDGMPWAFRQKASFVFGRGPEGELSMGHFARGTHDVVAVSECPVHAPRANKIAFALYAELRRAGIKAWDGRGGLLRHLVIRTSADEREAVAVLVVAQDDKQLREPLRRLLASPDRPDGLMLNIHDRPGPYQLGRESLRIDGPGHVLERVAGLQFLVSPTGFFQTNVAAAAELLRLVQAALPPRPGLRILDLYAGSGLFALPLARQGHHVTAVEESRKATRDAARNARRSGVPEARLRLVPSHVEDALPRLPAEGFDVVILDPPRQGCPEPVLRQVAERLRPERLLLVSCNPEALARELALLLPAGYRARLVQPVDMFPHTPHIETLAVLERLGASPRPARPSSRGRGSAARRAARRAAAASSGRAGSPSGAAARARKR